MRSVCVFSQERQNSIKNGCSYTGDDSEHNTTPDGQILQVGRRLYCLVSPDILNTPPIGQTA